MVNFNPQKHGLLIWETSLKKDFLLYGLKNTENTKYIKIATVKFLTGSFSLIELMSLSASRIELCKSWWFLGIV